MNNAPNPKRQRQKEQRRLKQEQERKAALARKRKKTFLLVGLAVAVAVAVLFVNQGNDRDPDASATPTPTSSATPTASGASTAEVPADPSKPLATMSTSEGELQIELASDTSPNVVAAFTRMAKEGFYNGLTFHRIVQDFAIQGGDPNGDGTGGPPTKTVDPIPEGFRYVRGTVAMAKGSVEPVGTAGSQFFIVPSDAAADRLTPEYAVLGRVVTGLDTIDKLNAVETELQNGEPSKPTRPVTIEKVEIKDP